jgi:hypothetical protein
MARAVRVEEEDGSAVTDAPSQGPGSSSGPRMVGKYTKEGLRVFRAAERSDPTGVTFGTGRNDRYYWLVEEGGGLSAGLVLTLILLLVFAMTLQSIWPPVVRTAIWYVAVTILLVIAGLTVLQLVVFSVCWLVGWEVWIVPNLWGEGYNPFAPLYSVQRSEGSAVIPRLALAGIIVAMFAWAYQQPSEVQAIFDTQRQIIDDLYSGKLLSDTAADPGGTGSSGLARGPGNSFGFGKWGPGSNRYGGRSVHIPNIEEIEKLVDDEEGGEEGGKAAKHGAAEEAAVGDEEEDGAGAGAGAGDAAAEADDTRTVEERMADEARAADDAAERAAQEDAAAAAAAAGEDL